MQTIQSLYVKFKSCVTLIALIISATFFLSCNPSQSNDLWASLEPLPLDPNIEDQIDEILPKLTLEQKVGQVIQGDTDL